MKNNQKQKESPLLLKQQYSLDKTPTPTYPSNFTYNYETVAKDVAKDGSPALIGGMKKRRNQTPGQTLGHEGHVHEDSSAGKLGDEPGSPVNVDSPQGDWKPLLPPPNPPQPRHLHENPTMTSFKPAPENVNASNNARPGMLPLPPGGRVPPPVPRRHPHGPVPPLPPQPKRAPPPPPRRPAEGCATLPLHRPSPPVSTRGGPGNYNTSPRGAGRGRGRNPASARLLEYCDNLLAELEHMANN